MNRFIFFCLFALSFKFQTALAQNTIDCDAIYAKRGALLFQSADCYEKLYINKNITAEVYFEHVFTALSTAVLDFEKKPEEKIAIDKALVAVEEVKKVLGEKAYYNYWKAVWISFEAALKDRGSLVPTTMFGRISTIQTLLKSSINENPSLHFYGPHRVLGLMHTQMPKIAGGDKKYAEELLRIAYINRPQYHSHPYSYANILYINGKNTESKKILNQFLATPDVNFENNPNESLRTLLPEIQKEKSKAIELLKVISEEEG